MSKTKFNLVIVKSKTENKYFIGKLPAYLKIRNLAILRNLIEYKGREGTCPYKKLTEYVLSKGGPENLDGFTVACYKNSYEIEEISELIYNTQKKLIYKYGEDCILNDVVINPARYQCQCWKMVREQFREKHEKEYCIVGDLELEFLVAV